MQIEMLKAKIHRATVTQAELNYVGSITIDSDLLQASGIREYAKVDIVNIDNGERFSTYTIAGEAGSGVICLNGAAARCACTGDKVIIMSYCTVTVQEASDHKPTVLFVDERNRLVRLAHYEKHGKLENQA